MKIIRRRFDRVRELGGEELAFTRLSNAAYLLGYREEEEQATDYRSKLDVVCRAFSVEAGHVALNILRQQKRIASLSYENVLRKAGRDLGLQVSLHASGEEIEGDIVERLLGLNEAWIPISPLHRDRLTSKLNKELCARGAPLKGCITRALSVALTLRSLKTSVKDFPPWAKRGTFGGTLATVAFGIYKLGMPDYSRVVYPCILLFALLRADIALAETCKEKAI